jgi:hypothetical protein
MAPQEAHSKHAALASVELVPVHLAAVLRQVQAACELAPGITISLDVDEWLYASADPELLASVLRSLLAAASARQHSGAIIALSCHAEDAGVRIEAEGEADAKRWLTAEELGAPEMTFLHGAMARMNGGLTLSYDHRAGELFRLSLPLARPSRVSSRPPRAR